MKKILPYLLVVFIIPTSISSCKKDKKEAPKVEIGKWFFEKVVSEEFNHLDSLIGMTIQISYNIILQEITRPRCAIPPLEKPFG